jgi:pimeloyl-[acyl-carrier protein] methyl ester esterase
MNWLLLRGLGREKSHWYTFPEKLEKSLPSGKVHLINLPGVSGKEENAPIKIDKITDHIRSIWLKSKHQGDYSLLGVSLGGMVAIDWCHRYPQDFKHLMTINSSSANHSGPLKRITPMALKTIVSLAFKRDLRLREKKVLELTTNTTIINDEILNHWVKAAIEHPLDKKVFISQLFAASKFILPKKISTPYTVLTSKADRFTHYSCSEKLAKQFDANIYYHETAGHDLPMDEPEWVIKRILSIKQNAL